MPHITLTKEHPVYPMQDYLIDNRIDRLATVPAYAKLFTVKNVNCDGSSFQFLINFSDGNAKWNNVVSQIDINNPFVLVAPGQKVYYYITLSDVLDYTTEVSFDLEFE